MARKIADTPTYTAVIRIGAYYYPVIMQPERGPHAYLHCQDHQGAPLNFTRRYAAVQYLWRRERDSQPVEPLNPCPRCGAARTDPYDPHFCEACFQEYAR